MKTKILLFIIAFGYAFISLANNGDSGKNISKPRTRINPLHANGFNYVSFGLEIGPILYDFGLYSLYYGLPVKVYLGRQKKGRFIVRSGIHFFPVPSNNLIPEIKSINKTSIPLAVGYRRNIHEWYMEGSLGIGASIFRVKFTDPSRTTSKSSFREINYGLEVGRQFGDLDIGLVVYNTGPIPFNMVFAGLKGSYRLKW